MTYQTFTGSAEARRRYWARSYLGWRHIARAVPNDGHRAVAELSRRGLLTGIITQNVDGLHQAAGPVMGGAAVTELHGSLHWVVCLSCGQRTPRTELARRLEAANPGWDAELAAAIKPDGDADTDDEAIASFQVVDCSVCHGVLKPDVVFFGENVPRPRAEACYALVERSSALVVLGSSLTVMSGFRYVRHAARRQRPIVIVNQGATRGDTYATATLDAPLGRTLTELVTRIEERRLTAGDDGFDVVTGAFSYSGAAIASELQAAGRRVRTITGHPDRAPKAPAGTGIEVMGSGRWTSPIPRRSPSRCAAPGRCTTPTGCGSRTARSTTRRRWPVRAMLFLAAAEAGVQRIVHVSITHPSADSPYPYFRGKAAVEQALRDFGISHAVLRPAILFGGNGVLINNIAWLLRRLPVFAVGGSGEYRVRPIHVDDLARLCVRAGNSATTETIDAVGPERPAFIDLVRTIKDAVGSRSQIVRVPGALIPPAARLLGLALRDTLLTADEYQGMADGLADTDGPATGETALSRWIIDHKDTLGRGYANELTRHFR